jgi:hypothetical protein
VGPYTFSAGGISHHTYVIEHDGHHYPIRHSALRSSMPAEMRRRMSKPPRPMAADIESGVQSRTATRAGAPTQTVTRRKRAITPATVAPRTRQLAVVPNQNVQQVTDGPAQARVAHVRRELLVTSRPLRENAAVGVRRFIAGPAPSPSAAHRDARLRDAGGSR